MQNLSTKNLLIKIGSVFLVLLFVVQDFILLYDCFSGWIGPDGIFFIVFGIAVIIIAVMTSIRIYKKSLAISLIILVSFEFPFLVIFHRNFYLSLLISIAKCLPLALIIVACGIKDSGDFNKINESNNYSENAVSGLEEVNVQTEIVEEGKTIVKTKILNMRECETLASKRKGKWLSALASGLTAGMGGNSTQTMFAGHAQNAYNTKNAKFETVVTFLVIYNDNSRKTVDVIKNDENYNQLIMYLD